MTQPNSHEHRWAQLHEEFLLGGSTPVGWICLDCDKQLSNSDLSPSGIGGKTTKTHILVGPHGGHGNCQDGSVYKKQIIYDDGRLEVVR